MPSRIALIQGHPAKEQNHFCHALAESYVLGARASGHQVDILNPPDDLPYIRNQSEWSKPQSDPTLLKAQKIIAAANHLVIIYPLWLGDMPALLKSYLEHLSSGGFMMKFNESGGWTRGLKGKSARIVVTMGMPAVAYRLFYFSHSLKSLERNILKFSGASPVRSTLMGGVEGDKREKARQRWLKEMQEMGQKGQ